MLVLDDLVGSVVLAGSIVVVSSNCIVYLVLEEVIIKVLMNSAQALCPTSTPCLNSVKNTKSFKFTNVPTSSVSGLTDME